MKQILILSTVILICSCSQKPAKVVEWKSIERSLQTQFIAVEDNDTIDLPEGNFMFTKSINPYN